MPFSNYYTSCSTIVVGCILYSDPARTTPVTNGYYADASNCYVVDNTQAPYVNGYVVANINCGAVSTTTSTSTTSTTTSSTTTTTTTSVPVSCNWPTGNTQNIFWAANTLNVTTASWDLGTTSGHVTVNYTHISGACSLAILYGGIAVSATTIVNTNGSFEFEYVYNPAYGTVVTVYLETRMNPAVDQSFDVNITCPYLNYLATPYTCPGCVAQSPIVVSFKADFTPTIGQFYKDLVTNDTYQVYATYSSTELGLVVGTAPHNQCFEVCTTSTTSTTTTTTTASPTTTTTTTHAPTTTTTTTYIGTSTTTTTSTSTTTTTTTLAPTTTTTTTLPPTTTTTTQPTTTTSTSSTTTTTTTLATTTTTTSSTTSTTTSSSTTTTTTTHCYNCGDGTLYFDYIPTPYYKYPDTPICNGNTSGHFVPDSMFISWASYSRPNRFTVYDSNGIVWTSGWVGTAAYPGPWGASLSTATFGTVLITFTSPTGRFLRVETGPAAPMSPLSDNAAVSLQCNTPTTTTTTLL